MLILFFNNLKIFTWAIFLVLCSWVFLGFNPSLIIGLNDIAHHLLTLKIGSNLSPFFTPIYDWLWMGGSLVAPNVGHIPLERLFLWLGLGETSALNLTIVFFQASIFIFTFDLVGKNHSFTFFEKTTSGLAVAFLPLITLRIIYGHTSLYFPVLFNLIFLWLIISETYCYFLLLLAIFLNYILFTGPYFQVLFYSIVLFWPFIIYYFRNKIFNRWKFFISFYLIPFFFSIDFIYLVFCYMRSPDIFRSFHSSQLIYSYAKLVPLDIADLFSYYILNIRNVPFFLLHETKAFIGVFPFIFLIYYKRKNILSIIPYLFCAFFIYFFIFSPPSLEFIFYKIPLINMFRIPQRSLLAIVPVIYVLFFIRLPLDDYGDKLNHYYNLFLILFMLLLGNFSLFYFDIVLILIYIVYFFGHTIFPIKRITILLLIVIGNVFFIQNHPQNFTPKYLANIPSNFKPSLIRQDFGLSNLWQMNTSRALSQNSAFGYTFPIPLYKNLYLDFFEPEHSGAVDPLYFAPIRTNPYFTNFISLYRYHQNPLVYSPEKLTSSYESFRGELFNPLSTDIHESKLAFISNTNVCGSDVKISNETLNFDQFHFSFTNTRSVPCSVVLPFNFSSFLSAKSNQKYLNINHANISQMSVELPSGNGDVTIGPNNIFFWRLKYIGMILGFIGLLFLLADNNNRWLNTK